MANASTGSRSYVRYAYEHIYNTAPSDASMAVYFGHNVKFSPTPKNNLERIYGLNDRNVQKYAAKKFEGTFGVDFQVSNWYFMKGVIGAVTTAGGGPYTHTYAEANAPSGATIQLSEDLDIDSERTFTGCVFNTLTLNLNVGEVVTGKIDGLYASESKDSTLNTAGNLTDPEEVFTFANGIVTLSGGTLTEVQSLEARFSNNAELIWGTGSRKATQRAFKNRSYEFTINKIREADTELIDRFYGSSTTLSDPGTPISGAYLWLMFTNGKTGTDERAFSVKFDDIRIDEPTTTIEPSEVIKEGATLIAMKINSVSGAYYKNNTTPHP